MHVIGITLDLRWFLQFIFTAFVISFGLLHLVKNTASKYFEVDANFEATGGGGRGFGKAMPGTRIDPICAVCGNDGPKVCSRCKAVRYCSPKCQAAHWKSHKLKCKDFQQASKANSGDIPLVIENGTSKPLKQIKRVLFPYDEFVDLYNWERPGYPPCGLINCGNSCFVNVVLQCLASTRPLVAYLLKRGHRRECRRNDWCFLCELQTHLERATNNLNPFSPVNILSRLPNIGGNLGYGRQEDAHECMRFAIDTMQSVCLDEFGGEKAVHPSSQETTLIQHIFGGQLQSQVICGKCNKVSNQYENMMDLTVEIHGDAASLEECLEQYTAQEWLHGDNMYRCEGCNDYVKAWKRLTVWHAPNILTIALKRFQSGRFGKLNKKVNFPETLDLGPYMSEAGDGTDVYKLYAVVVHLDMLNASFFGHYICYTKDFSGNWYRNDDCKVTRVEAEEVLSQGAYMLLYSRVTPRPSCLMSPDISVERIEKESSDSEPCSAIQAENNSASGGSKSEEITAGEKTMCLDSEVISGSVLPNGSLEPSTSENSEAGNRDPDAADSVEPRTPLTLTREISILENESVLVGDGSNGLREEMMEVDVIHGELGSSTPQENGVHCNGKAPCPNESSFLMEECADEQVVPQCPSSPTSNLNLSEGQ
ncbi:hypothetical protein CDL15_Pgr015894 [Punica granatum]|uniref:Ubiquitin carboxyl-terminal hydrolase 18-like n=1 Tax=Punica granatum TaxID=22663 RepID=A0A218XPZ2_PUNGR|nr:hypothetical protein CDL15_Pgr015894 [Punica granatum]